MFHSIPILTSFGPSSWNILRQSQKAMAVNHILISDHCEEEMHQTDIHP